MVRLLVGLLAICGGACAQRVDQLCTMYRNADGAAKDAAAAYKWCLKDAEEGQPIAQLWVGEMALHGEGTPRDPAEALKWFSRAAAQGEIGAQMKLARLYESGDAGEKDLRSA